MKPMPQSVSAYKRTKIFTENTIPKGLLQDHSTMEGTWGKIVVLEGRLLYVIQSDPPEEVILDPTTFGVVEPTILHFVKPLDKVSFYVEFYR